MFITAGAVSVLGVGLGLICMTTYCALNECCNEKWIKSDPNFLNVNFFSNFCGQHVARSIILKAVGYHWRDPEPKKPLVLSFHGPPGTGKTLMALMLRDAMFYKQHETKYFNFISAAEFYPFPKDANDILEYKTKFREKIRQAVHGCERALIVIDDLHLLSVQLLDTLAPFLRSKEQVDGISYRKAIFILTSLYGDSGLIQFAADYHRKGVNIHEVPFMHSEDILTALYLANTEFSKCELVWNHLIDYFVPFFPMDGNQIECCVKQEVTRRPTNHHFYMENRRFMESVLQNIEFVRRHDLGFAGYGCKPIKKAVSLVD